MTDLLIKLFIKKNASPLKTREKYGVLSGFTGIVCNLLLCILKFVAGTLTNSVSVSADAVNNLTDAGTNFVTVMGAKIAGKPVDKDHPFGHGRMEYVAALIVSVFIFLMGFELGKSSIMKIISPETVKFSAVSLAILLCSVAVKLWMAYFNGKLYKLSDNLSLKAVRQDSIGDCVSTLAAAAAMLISAFTPFRLADGIIGTAGALLVLKAGADLLKEVSSRLLGKAPSPELVEKIKKIILEEKNILNVHDLIVHEYGPQKIIASAHAEVPNDLDLMTAHGAIDRVEQQISKELGVMISIHPDPVAVNDKITDKYRKLTEEIIKNYDSSFSFHDFKAIKRDEKTNLVFELVIPHGYGKENSEIIKELRKEFGKRDESLNPIITAEHDFV